jgi:hypothetical protein
MSDGIETHHVATVKAVMLPVPDDDNDDEDV